MDLLGKELKIKFQRSGDWPQSCTCSEIRNIYGRWEKYGSDCFYCKYNNNIIIKLPPIYTKICPCKLEGKYHCGKCKTQFYCSKKCQHIHWKLEHKDKCIYIDL